MAILNDCITDQLVKVLTREEAILSFILSGTLGLLCNVNVGRLMLGHSDHKAMRFRTSVGRKLTQKSSIIPCQISNQATSL